MSSPQSVTTTKHKEFKEGPERTETARSAPTNTTRARGRGGPPNRPRPVPILRYDVAADPAGHAPRRSTVTPAVFARHRRMIQRARRHFMTVTEYCSALRSADAPPDAIVVTFDGDRAETFVAARELAERGHAATVFVTTSRLGAPGMLSEADIRRLHELGVEIGASGHSGRRLDGLHRSDVTAEITLSRRRLAAITGEEPRSFAYPRGGWDPPARQLVIAAGYSAACAVGEALSHPGDDPFALTRLTVGGGLTDHRVRAWLDGIGRTLPRTFLSGSRLRLVQPGLGVRVPTRVSGVYHPLFAPRAPRATQLPPADRPGHPQR
ncbi:polysaccharide deacetylase [Frankia sp. R43]|uniref:polysaccharide deacetylase family protein n=1 Tax=Frankia sp. R43 TaxID=269536 RepID=UPI0006CA1A0A|nr:polysaccharide deacetylase family protein [Frankia sp. R43]KPM57449.1 polysaccharide deacetylase [Frankia sp. R43]